MSTAAQHCSYPCTDKSSANPPFLFNIHLILCSYPLVVFKVVSVLHVFFKKKHSMIFDSLQCVPNAPPHLFSPVCANCPATFIPFDFIMLIILHEYDLLRSSTFCRSLQPPFTYSLLCPNVFLSTLFSNTPSLCSSLNVQNHASRLYKITGKVLFYVIQCPHF